MKRVVTRFWLLLLSLLSAVEVCGEIQLTCSSASVPQYDKVEFSIELATDPQQPCGPRLVIQLPDGNRVELPAFSQQRYERKIVERAGKPALWLYPQGLPVWRARFAPWLTGEHTAHVEASDGARTRQSRPVTFVSAANTARGFVRVCRQDPRYFEFANGEPFFPVGQNLAFIGDSQYVTPAAMPAMLEKLSSHGVNYLRVWTCCHDWALAIEARKSAWSRSWNWQPPFAPLPQQDDPEPRYVHMQSAKTPRLEVAPAHPVALCPGREYLLSGRVRLDPAVEFRVRVGSHELPPPRTAEAAQEWQEFRLSFTTGADQWWLERTELLLEGSGSAWLDQLSLQETRGGPNLLWEAEVNRPERGFYNPIDCAQLDEIVDTAQRCGIYLQLCLLTRDAYMGDLKDDTSEAYTRAIQDAQNLLRYAVARWGYATSVVTWEYFNENDPGLPIERFHREVGEYLRKIDIYGHLRSTSTWHPSARDCRDPYLDVADLHYYLRPVEPRTYRDEVEAVLGNAAWLREHAPAKPALIGEFGLADAQWRETQEMKASREVVDFHNALWASALAGTSGTALYWWWDRLDPREHVGHYRPLADYLAGIPWTTARLEPASARTTDPTLQLVGLQGSDQAYWWLFDPQASWDNVVIRHREPPTRTEVHVALAGLAPGRYQVQWWDTRTGKVVAQEERSPADGALSVTAPPFQRDIAGKLLRRP